jgi:hypothetical protein
MASNYPYRELRAQDNEIRLLTLHHGNTDAQIECSLQHASLDRSLTYTALSYTWGDASQRKPIQIDGFEFQVTVNLYDALHALRHPQENRVFWIDAICINQDDVPERNKQVLRMRDIYSLADTVQVWLGKADENSYTAMDLVGQLAEVVQDPEDMLANGLQNSHRDTWEELFEASKPSTIRALNQLFQRSWWTRVWVVQELSLANQVRARVRCGTGR